MKNRTQILLNFLIPASLFVLSFGVGNISNSYIATLGTVMNRTFSRNAHNLLSYVSIFSFVLLIISMIGFIVGGILVVKNTGHKYLIKAEHASLLIAIVLIVNMTVPIYAIYLYILPYLNSLD